MIVTLATDGLLVQDADDCRRLHLETALDDDALRVALRGTGTGELAPDGDAWLDLATLRARAQLAASAPDWAQRWSAMIDYATREGWVSPDGRAVQVHVQRAAQGGRR